MYEQVCLERVSKRFRLLYSSGGGGAFVDTAQLDGESALKPKQAVDDTQHMIRNGHSGNVEGHLEVDLPNELVGKFDGCVYLKGVQGEHRCT